MSGFTGACRFCGQIADPGPNEIFESQREADDWATLNCTCNAAKAFAAIEKQKIAGRNNVDSLFGESSDGFSACDPVTVDFLKKAVDLVADEMIGTVTVVVAGDGKAKISLTGKKNIRVSRSQGRSVTLEG